MFFCFVFYCYGEHRDIHVLTPPFPTRRASALPRSSPPPPERGVRRGGRRVSSSGSTALCDNCCIAASRGFHPSRAGQGGSRGVHQVSETSAIEQVTLN